MMAQAQTPIEVTTIEQINNPELTLITDPFEAREVLRHIGADINEYDSVFVNSENGHYTEVWGFVGHTAQVYKRAFRLL